MHALYDFTVSYNFSYVSDQASSLVNFFFSPCLPNVGS